MWGKQLVFIFAALLLVTPALADITPFKHQFDSRFPDWRRFEDLGNQFDYRVNLNNIDWFDRGLYFSSLQFQPCIDLNEYYAYADSDRYDRYDRDDIERYTDRLDYNDLLRVANNNYADNIDGNEFNQADDFKCTRASSFNDFANQNKADRWDEDDFYQTLNYPNRQQYDVRTRHQPYEGRISRYYDGAYAGNYPLAS